MKSNQYTFGKLSYLGFDETIEAVKQALATEGFGILTDIDVATTMKKKLNIDAQPYRILGACNPALAHEAITADASIGALLPCNVVVRQDKENGVYIEFMDPESVLDIVSSSRITEIGKQVRAKLERVLNAL
ncbi:MAG TPA: DUF302 domain-containing protein [Gammaproteobacteria bacterium]